MEMLFKKSFAIVIPPLLRNGMTFNGQGLNLGNNVSRRAGRSFLLFLLFLLVLDAELSVESWPIDLDSERFPLISADTILVWVQSLDTAEDLVCLTRQRVIASDCFFVELPVAFCPNLELLKVESFGSPHCFSFHPNGNELSEVPSTISCVVMNFVHVLASLSFLLRSAVALPIFITLDSEFLRFSLKGSFHLFPVESLGCVLVLVELRTCTWFLLLIVVSFAVTATITTHIFFCFKE